MPRYTRGRQTYTPVIGGDLDLDAMKARKKHGPLPQRLDQRSHKGQETERMPGPQVPVVNAKTRADKSVAMNNCRTYEKGKKNRTRS